MKDSDKPIGTDAKAAGTDSVREAAFDQERLLNLVEGDRELLRELIDLFVEDSQRLLEDLRETVRSRNAGEIERIAHTLKGSAGNFGAHATCEAALRLETMGRERTLSAADAACATLEAEVQRLRTALTAFRNTSE